MSGDPPIFDRYDVVLGIPAGSRPANCPPNHYDLIGATMFEPDLSVLANTADAQIIRLRKSKIDHETMNQLFYELCLARGVLTNAATKAGYDRQLRADFEMPAGLFAGSMETPSTGDGEIDTVPFGDADFGLVVGRPKKKRSSPLLPILVNLAIFGGAMLYFRPFDQKTAVREKPQTDPSSGPPTGYWPEKPKPMARKQEIVPLDPPPAAPVASMQPRQVLQPPPAPAPPANPLSREPSDEAMEEPGDLADIAIIEAPQNEPAAAEQRSPIPPGERQATAMASLMEIYGKEIAEAHKAKSHAIMLNIRQQLIDAASGEQDAAVKFAMLGLAYRISIDASQLDLAIELADSIADQFEIDELPLRWEAINEYSKKHGKEAGLRQMMRDLVRQAQDAEQLDLALVAMQRLHATHPKSTLWKTKDLEAAVGAVKQLRSDAKQAGSAEVLGEYLCFVLEHWKSGLPLLAGGTNKQLREIAAADLAEPDDTAAQFRLAERWWDFDVRKLPGEDVPEKAEVACHARAAYWYQKAVQPSSKPARRPVEQDMDQDSEKGMPE